MKPKEKIKLWRILNGKTQQDIAVALNCSQNRIAGIESGRYATRDTAVEILAKYFGLDEGYLKFNENPIPFNGAYLLLLPPLSFIMTFRDSLLIRKINELVDVLNGSLFIEFLKEYFTDYILCDQNSNVQIFIFENYNIINYVMVIKVFADENIPDNGTIISSIHNAIGKANLNLKCNVELPSGIKADIDIQNINILNSVNNLFEVAGIKSVSKVSFCKSSYSDFTTPINTMDTLNNLLNYVSQSTQSLDKDKIIAMLKDIQRSLNR